MLDTLRFHSFIYCQFIYLLQLVHAELSFLQAHPKVAERLKSMIKKWAQSNEFKNDQALRYAN